MKTLAGAAAILLALSGCAAQGGAPSGEPPDAAAGVEPAGSSSGFQLRFHYWIGSEAGTFLRPVSLAVTPTGRIFIADSGQFRVAQFTDSGQEMGALGGAGASARFEQPIDVAVGEGLAAYVLVGDASNRRVDQYDFTGNLVGTVVELGDAADFSPFSDPRSIAVDASGTLFVSDAERDRVVVYGSGAVPRFAFGGYGTAHGSFIDPWGIAIDEFRDRIYVADSGNARIQVFDTVGGFRESWSLEANARPAGLDIDSRGRLWVADAGMNRILAFDPLGHVLVDSGGGAGEAAFRGPQDVAVDRDGTVYVVDTANARVGAFTVVDASRGP